MINFAVQLKYRSVFKLIVLAVLGCFGGSVLLLLISRYGAGLTPDSVAYISVARNLADGNGFISFNGTPFIIQPPLYPIMLAVIKKIFLIDPLISAGYFNAVLFGLTVYLSGIFFQRYLKSFILVICGTIAVLISYALVQFSFMALSEPLFILFVLLFLYFYEKYQSKQDYLSLIILSIWGAFACLTRYTGVVLILTGAICIFFQNRNNNVIRYRHSIIFLLITGLPAGIWVIRNYLLSGTLAEHRGASSYTLFQNVQLVYNTAVSWFFPLNSTFVYILIILILITVWFIFGVGNKKAFLSGAVKLIGPSLIFITAYSGIIIITSTTTAYDKISDRLLSPIYIPLILIILFVTDKILIWLKKYFNRQAAVILVCLVFVFIIRYPAKNTIHFIDDYMKLTGWGYSCNSWRQSETIDYINRHVQLENMFALYSNEPEAVYILTNNKTSRSPIKTFYNSNQLYNIKQDQEEVWRNAENVYLIWFNKTERNFLFSIDELKKNINLKKVAGFEDGEIYLITKTKIHP